MSDVAFDIDVAERLAASGVSVDVIARSFSVPTQVLVRTLQRTTLTPEDRQLSAGMRQIAWRAYSHAMWVFDQGHPSDQLALTKTILTRVAGLIGQESSTSFEESKEAVTRILAAQRQGVTPMHISTDPLELDEYAPPSQTPLGGVDDSGQEAPHDEDPLFGENEADWG